jgi:hypothetical protein
VQNYSETYSALKHADEKLDKTVPGDMALISSFKHPPSLVQRIFWLILCIKRDEALKFEEFDWETAKPQLFTVYKSGKSERFPSFCPV